MKRGIFWAAFLCLLSGAPLSAAPVDSPYYGAVRADNPLVYYAFDESVGPTAGDSSANGRNGTYGNAYTLGQASARAGLGTAVLFNSGNVAMPALGTHPQVSLEYWINPTTASGDFRTIYNVDGWYTAALHNQLYNGNNRLSVNGNSATDVDFPGIAVNAWQHVVVTYDTAAKRTVEYVNGVGRAVGTYGTAQPPVLNAAHIGQWNGNSRPFLGTMDEFAVYGSALSPSQVVAHYHAATSALPTTSYETTVLNDSPKLFYRFNDAPGSGTATDSSGNAKHGTPSNVTFGQAGAMAGLGTAAAFNNSNSNIVAPALGSMSQLSIETWLRPTTISTDFDTIFDVRNWTTGAVHYQLRNNQLEFSIYGKPDLYFGSAAAFPLNAWTHVITTYNQATGEVSVYVNGVLLGTQTHTSPVGVNLAAADIGAWNGNSRAFDGSIDELSIYDYVLSPQQIASHYLAGANEFDADIPEPATFVLMGLCLAGLRRYARRRK